jgi:hypothetical protein
MQLALQEHPSVEVLEEYWFNRLPKEAMEKVEEHLLVCQSCQNTFEEVEEYIHLMKAATAEYMASPSPASRMPVARAWQNVRHAAGRSSRASIPAWTAFAVAGVLAATWAYSSLRSDSPGAPIPVRLAAMRGGGNNGFTRAPAGRPLDLALDTTELSVPAGQPGKDSYRIEIVSSSGHPVWGSVALRLGREVVLRTPQNLSAGAYWVRLYAGQGNKLLREYGLTLE